MLKFYECKKVTLRQIRMEIISNCEIEKMEYIKMTHAQFKTIGIHQ